MMFQTNYAFYQDSEDLEQTVNTTRPAAVDIQLKLYAIFMPLIGILIIVLNLAIVISSGLILHRGQQPRSTYIFLGNVALSDLLIGIAILFGHFYPKNLRHEMACCIQVGMIVSATITSGYSVGLIAVDRYLYILYGLQYQRYIYPNRARIMILMSWLLGLILGFLPAMGVRNDTNNGKLCWFIILVPPELVLTTTTFGMIPLAVIIVLYSIILRHALKKISQLKKAARDNRGTHSGNLRLFRGGHYSRGSTISVLENDAQQCGSEQEQPFRKKIFKCFKQSKNKNETLNIAPVYNPSKWKAIKIVLYTTGCYFVTWFPFFLASALFATCNPNRTPIFCDVLRVAIASPLAILGFTNSLLNPIIYAWWHNGFRESVKKIYRGICGDKYNKNDFSDSSKQRNTVSFRSGNTALTDMDSSDNEQKVIHVRNSVIPETESTNL